MAGFKDMVAADVRGVFINPLEFAEPHDINGVELQCVIDRDTIQERNLRSYKEYAEGVFVDMVEVFIPSEDIQRPVNGEIMRLDGAIFLVVSSDEEMGILKILLQANET